MAKRIMGTIPEELDFRVSKAAELMSGINIQRFTWLSLVSIYAFDAPWYFALAKNQMTQASLGTPGTAIAHSDSTDDYLDGTDFTDMATMLNSTDSGKTWDVLGAQPWDDKTILYVGDEPTIRTNNAGISFTSSSGVITGSDRFAFSSSANATSSYATDILCGVGDVGGTGPFQTAIEGATNPKMAFISLGGDASTVYDFTPFNTKDRTTWTQASYLTDIATNYYAANPGAANVGSWIIYDAG